MNSKQIFFSTIPSVTRYLGLVMSFKGLHHQVASCHKQGRTEDSYPSRIRINFPQDALLFKNCGF